MSASEFKLSAEDIATFDQYAASALNAYLSINASTYIPHDHIEKLSEYALCAAQVMMQKRSLYIQDLEWRLNYLQNERK